MLSPLCALVTATCVLWVSTASASPLEEETENDRYALDEVSRAVPRRGRVKCPRVALIRYRGTSLRYHKPVRVYQGFAERLALFEEVVRQTAIEIYGRAPVRIRHIGTYNCRRIRSWPTFISEHGLANAIDVEGFDFRRARTPEEREAAPRHLRRGFRVRVLRHWNGRRGTAAIHSLFLRTLARRLVARKDIFRVLLGPSYPGHKNHFHFDVSPWRIIDIFED